MANDNHTSGEILRRARELIARPDGACFGASAEKKNGYPCVEDHPDAVRFDLLSALRVEAHKLLGDDYGRHEAYACACDAVACCVNPAALGRRGTATHALIEWADASGRTQADYIEALDSALFWSAN